METLMLATTYPCCERPARLRAIVEVPRETYRRRCAGCETTWQVARTTTMLGGGVRVDCLTWTDTCSTDYVRQYAPARRA
jgi:hypothetical protein